MAELIDSEIEFDDKSLLELKCDLCRLVGETQDGIIVCVDCMECLCITCSEVHSHNGVYKGHKTFTKDSLPLNFTSQTLCELKDMIFCRTHEVKFDYYCENHATCVCQLCMKKSHRSCNRITEIQNLQSSPQYVLSEIQENRKWFQEVTKQRKEINEQESVEMKRQNELKTTIIAKIQAFTDQGSRGNNKDDQDDDTKALDLLFDDVKMEVQLQTKYEKLLSAVLHLNDTERTMAVSRRAAVSLVKSPMKKGIESILGRMGNAKTISNRLEILESVTDELLNASYLDDKGDFIKRIRQLDKEKAFINAGVQSQLYNDTNKEQLQNDCVTEPYKSSGVNANLDSAVLKVGTFKDVEVQTEVSSASSKTITHPRISEYLTASADLDKEPVDVTVPCTIQQSDISSVVHDGRDTDREDDICQIPDNTQHTDNNLPLLQSRLEHIGDYNVCIDGEDCIIQGIVILNNMRISLLNGKQLKIFDKCFRFQISYELKWYPIDICVVDYDLSRVAISFDSRRVETYEISENTIHYIRGFDLSLYCRGICSMSHNKIAVLVSDVESINESREFPHTNSDKDDMEIQIRDITNGRIISSFDKFEKEVRNPVFIIGDNQNNVIIGEENQVSAFNGDGERLWFYKSYKRSKLNNVLGMVMDSEGNIYACSQESNSIHQVSSYNYRDNRIIIPHVPFPCSIAYDHQQKRLIVGSAYKSVNVYRFV